MTQPRAGILRRLDETGIPLLIIRFVLAGLFLYMAADKVLHPVDFLKLIREYHMLPETPPYFLNLTAVVLPWLEVVCAVALLLGISVRGSALTLLGMLLVFTPVVFIRSLSIYHELGVPYCQVKFDCGCGTGPVYVCSKLVENSTLILLSLLAALSRSRRFCLNGLFVRERQAAPVHS